MRCTLRSVQPWQCPTEWSGGMGQLHSLLAESLNHYYASDLLPDLCGIIVERDRTLVQSDLSGLLDLTFIRCGFSCILPARRGCFRIGNLTTIYVQICAAEEGGGGLLQGADLPLSPRKKKQQIVDEFSEKNQRAHCKGGGGCSSRYATGKRQHKKGSKRPQWKVFTQKKTNLMVNLKVVESGGKEGPRGNPS